MIKYIIRHHIKVSVWETKPLYDASYKGEFMRAKTLKPLTKGKWIYSLAILL